MQLEKQGILRGYSQANVETSYRFPPRNRVAILINSEFHFSQRAAQSKPKIHPEHQRPIHPVLTNAPQEQKKGESEARTPKRPITPNPLKGFFMDYTPASPARQEQKKPRFIFSLARFTAPKPLQPPKRKRIRMRKPIRKNSS